MQPHVQPCFLLLNADHQPNPKKPAYFDSFKFDEGPLRRQEITEVLQPHPVYSAGNCSSEQLHRNELRKHLYGSNSGVEVVFLTNEQEVLSATVLNSLLKSMLLTLSNEINRFQDVFQLKVIVRDRSGSIRNKQYVQDIETAKSVVFFPHELEEGIVQLSLENRETGEASKVRFRLIKSFTFEKSQSLASYISKGDSSLFFKLVGIVDCSTSPTASILRLKSCVEETMEFLQNNKINQMKELQRGFSLEPEYYKKRIKNSNRNEVDDLLLSMSPQKSEDFGFEKITNINKNEKRRDFLSSEKNLGFVSDREAENHLITKFSGYHSRPRIDEKIDNRRQTCNFNQNWSSKIHESQKLQEISQNRQNQAWSPSTIKESKIQNTPVQKAQNSTSQLDYTDNYTIRAEHQQKEIKKLNSQMDYMMSILSSNVNSGKSTIMYTKHNTSPVAQRPHNSPYINDSDSYIVPETSSCIDEISPQKQRVPSSHRFKKKEKQFTMTKMKDLDNSSSQMHREFSRLAKKMKIHDKYFKNLINSNKNYKKKFKKMKKEMKDVFKVCLTQKTDSSQESSNHFPDQSYARSFVDDYHKLTPRVIGQPKGITMSSSQNFGNFRPKLVRNRIDRSQKHYKPEQRLRTSQQRIAYSTSNLKRQFSRSPGNRKRCKSPILTLNRKISRKNNHIRNLRTESNSPRLINTAKIFPQKVIYASSPKFQKKMEISQSRKMRPNSSKPSQKQNKDYFTKSKTPPLFQTQLQNTSKSPDRYKMKYIKLKSNVSPLLSIFLIFNQVEEFKTKLGSELEVIRQHSKDLKIRQIINELMMRSKLIE